MNVKDTAGQDLVRENEYIVNGRRLTYVGVNEDNRNEQAFLIFRDQDVAGGGDIIFNLVNLNGKLTSSESFEPVKMNNVGGRRHRSRKSRSRKSRSRKH